MKILIAGDWHIDNKAPKRRTDDYWKTVLGKLGFIVKLYRAHKCEFLLQPGDFFNSHRANDYLKSSMMDFFRGVKIFCVYGQHDMRYHNINRENTPLNVLATAGTVEILKSLPYVIPVIPTNIHGCNWGEEIPKPKEIGLNILVMHRMIINKEKLWPDQTDFIWADKLNDLGFDLIVTGDNHQSFCNDKVINCGSLMRTNILQVDHKPCVWIYDTDIRQAEKFFVPIEPMENVMDMETATADKIRNADLEAFVDGLKTDDPQTQNMDFKKNLKDFIGSNDIPKAVIKIIYDAMKEE